MKKVDPKITQIYGLTNKIRKDCFAYFADYDEVSFVFVKRKLAELLRHSGASYGCILRTRAKHYHLIILAFFEAQEIAAMHQLSKSDLAHIYYWFKFGENALRITKKQPDERDYKLVCECAPNVTSAIPNKLADYLTMAYGARISNLNRLPCDLNFVEYKLRDGVGMAYTNKFLTSKAFKQLLD